MRKLEYFWASNKDWYYLTENCDFVVRDDAPDEAKESYKKYLEQLRRIDRETERGFVVPKGAKGIQWYEEEGFEPDDEFCDNEYVLAYSIPYEEYCALSKINEIDDLLETYESRHLTYSQIKDYIKIIKTRAPELTKIIELLNAVLEYGTYIEFGETCY